MSNLLSRWLGGGFLIIIGVILTVQGLENGSLSTSLLAIVIDVVAFSLLYSVWREL